jgi:hypothetical protein
LKKLANHLSTKHPTLSKEERHRLLKRAKVVKPNTGLRTSTIPQRGSIREYATNYAPNPPKKAEDADIYTQLAQAGKKTWGFPMFPIEMFKDFSEWLMSPDGKLRSDTTAREICVDVSKCLKYLHPKTMTFDCLLDTTGTRKFFDICKKSGVQEDGLITKADRVATALTYLRLGADVNKRATIDDAVERISSWKRVWRKAKGKGRLIRLAESMESCPEPDVNAIKRCDALWTDVDQVISALRDDTHEVTSGQLKLVTGAMVGLVLAQSAQRPSAVMGATLAEYERATFIDGVWVINVHEHKTGRQGPARLTIDQDDKERLDNYVMFVRPALDPLNDHNKLFSLSGGRPLQDTGKLLGKIETYYHLSLPNCTQLRKELATKAALTCSSTEVALLSRQMSHSIETHKRAYEEIGTMCHAAQAHSLVQKLSLSSNEYLEDPKRTKMFWTGPQIAQLEDFFGKEIRELSHATTDRCKGFLGAYPIEGRKPKHVQDKVKSLIDKKKLPQL